MTVSKDRIISRTNPRVKELVRLRDEPSAERFLIEGKHLCDMAYESGCLLEVYTTKEVDYPDVLVTEINDQVLEKIAFSRSPSGIVGVATHNIPTIKTDKILFVDRVQDPGNMGTLLRCAVAFGYKHVLLTPGTANPFGNKAVAASQGAIFALNIIPADDPMAALDALRGRGVTLIGSALRNAVPLKSLKLKDGPIALIVGNEGQGVDEKLLGVCDKVVKIEMDDIESLNVGVAGGILMYSL